MPFKIFYPNRAKAHGQLSRKGSLDTLSGYYFMCKFAYVNDEWLRALFDGLVSGIQRYPEKDASSNKPHASHVSAKSKGLGKGKDLHFDFSV